MTNQIRYGKANKSILTRRKRVQRVNSLKFSLVSLAILNSLPRLGVTLKLSY